VADFRRRDLAHGGQGAPLVPAFHQKVFYSDKIDRAIVNIGGIANITLLPKNLEQAVVGFDTGPGNVLLDSWIINHLQKMHDENGDWARTGKVDQQLLTRLLMDPFFLAPPPKSTGREYFNLPWLEKYLIPLAPVDVQATLVELSARSILQAIGVYFSQGEIFVSGGGAHNLFLIERLQQLAQPNFSVASTEKLGIDPDWVEAMTFAWLARRTLAKKSGNLPSVTGARCEAVLGAVYFV
jgi:anhydro-N-acetylmuramic acid kinase